MSENTPDISVIMPARDAELYIGDAIRSVLDQQGVDLELIIAEDGSRDRTPEIAAAFAATDPRVRFFTGRGHGFVHALNRLIDEARAPLVARADADDVNLPKRLLRQMNYLRSRPGVVCVGGSVLFIDHRGETLGRGAALLSDDAIQDAALRGRSPVCHSAAMYRASAVRAVGGYRRDAHPAADLDLWLRLGEIGELANIPDDAIALRQHGASMTFRVARHLDAAAEHVCRQAARRRGVPPRYERVEDTPIGVVTATGIGTTAHQSTPVPRANAG